MEKVKQKKRIEIILHQIKLKKKIMHRLDYAKILYAQRYLRHDSPNRKMV